MHFLLCLLFIYCLGRLVVEVSQSTHTSNHHFLFLAILGNLMLHQECVRFILKAHLLFHRRTISNPVDASRPAPIGHKADCDRAIQMKVQTKDGNPKRHAESSCLADGAVRAKKRRRSHDTLKKTVSFEVGQNKQFVYHMTKEDQKASWYKRSEYLAMQEDNKATAISVKLGITRWIQPEQFCVRGLEASVIPHLGRTKLIRRQLLIASILQEQRAQKMYGVMNLDVMGELSQLLSCDASQEAVQLAFIDAQL